MFDTSLNKHEKNSNINKIQRVGKKIPIKLETQRTHPRLNRWMHLLSISSSDPTRPISSPELPPPGPLPRLPDVISFAKKETEMTRREVDSYQNNVSSLSLNFVILLSRQFLRQISSLSRQHTIESFVYTHGYAAPIVYLFILT